jgi:glycosyltransferase involved in cell wall biosynthesis
MLKKKNIVISGSNIKSGGPLTIFNYFLSALNERSKEFNTIAFVNNKKLFPNYSNILFKEIKWYKKFIPLKLFYEYVYYYFYSKKNNIDLWISLSDCNPNVIAKNRVSYFHNSIPSHKFEFREIWYSPLLYLQKYYSRFFYKINIKKNNFIIVQQSWFREYITNLFNYDIDNIIVFPPKSFVTKPSITVNHRSEHVFVYPTKAVYYKNNEILFKAFSKLPDKFQNNYLFYITLNGKENRYAKNLYKKYGHLKNIIWTGQLSSERMKAIYNKSNTLLFVSKLESWGLPLTEGAAYGLNIVTSRLPYAYETMSNYEKVLFIDTDNLEEIKDALISFITNSKIDFITKSIEQIKAPYFHTFNDCIDYISSKS